MLFYPDCVVDWQPLARMTDAVRCFLFCAKTAGQEPADIFNLANCRSKTLRSLFAKERYNDIDIGLMREAGIASVRAGQFAFLRREIGVGREKRHRSLLVAFLEAEPVDVYNRLLDSFTWIVVPIRPEIVEETHAVHLTMEQYMAHHWAGQERKIFLDAAPAAVAAIQAVDNRVRPLRLLGRPLRDALPALAEAMIEAQVRTLCTGRLGLEDEAACVGPVWSRTCPHLNLIVYCNHAWDEAAGQGFACGDLGQSGDL